MSRQDPNKNDGADGKPTHIYNSEWQVICTLFERQRHHSNNKSDSVDAEQPLQRTPKFRKG